MKPWQIQSAAAIAAYGILLLLSDTEAAGLAVVLAWGIAIEQVIETVSGPTGNHPLQDILGGVAGVSSGTTATPQQAATAGGSAGGIATTNSPSIIPNAVTGAGTASTIPAAPTGGGGILGGL
jgi:hypothetical protein